MARDKVRIRFRKDGDLRLLSHHDLMRTFERMLRRAALPFRSTEGFHPTPRMVFALSLPLGVAGLDEVVEVELNEEIPPEDVLERLRPQTPAGITFLSARRIAPNATALPRRAVYRLPVPPEEAGALAERCAALMAEAECWVNRAKPQPRRINIRPYVRGLRAGPDYLEMDLWVTPTGSARADELVGVLGLRHLLEAGAVLERRALELRDEVGPDAEPVPEISPARETTPPGELLPAGDDRTSAPSARWGASPNGPVVE